MYPKNNEKIMVDGAYLALAKMNLLGCALSHSRATEERKAHKVWNNNSF